MSPASVFSVGWLLDGQGEWHRGGGLLVVGGRIEAVLTSPRALERAERKAGVRARELGDRHMTPGLVNAHAHLELSGFAGLVDGSRGFVEWVRALLPLRAARTGAELAADVRAGARRALETGTTTIGDIDSTGPALRTLPRSGLRALQFREVIDAGDPQRTRAEARRIARGLAPLPGRVEGLSPHAPFTVSDPLLEAVARQARRRGLAVTQHWAESAEERDWAREGDGPLVELVGPPPTSTSLERLEANGLLGPGMSLVHANWPAPGEIERIAASGACVVHCPGCHAFFDRPDFPLEDYRRAGVPLALGTDSLASNADLDMAREMRLLRQVHPGLAPEEVWRTATSDAARALGLGAAVGELTVGAHADWLLFDLDETSRADPHSRWLDALTSGAASPVESWIGAQCRWSAASGPGPESSSAERRNGR